jgi:dihydroflavonol-4-reductase
MTILVTGASGFVGSAIVRKLLAQGDKVRVLVRPTSDRRNIEKLAVDIVEGDLTDMQSMKCAVSGCRALYHVAADYRLWVRDPDVLYRTNVEGTRDLMLLAMNAGIERVIYTSSVATLGLNKDGSAADENTPVLLADMIGHYKRSKFLAEEEVWRLIHKEGLPAVIVNPSTPIGPRDIKPTPTGRMIVDAAAGRMPAYVDTGLNLVHVDDVAEGHLLAYRKGKIGERYILGGINLTLREILIKIAEITHRRPPFIRLPQNLIFPLAYISEAWAKLTNGAEPRITVDGVKMSKKLMFFSSEKAKRELGYQFQPIERALIDAIEWFKANGYLG